VVVGSGPATESEGFDRETLALPDGQDSLVRAVAAVNSKTIVVVNAGMPMLLPWADDVAAIGHAWLPGQAMGDALADVLTGAAEPEGRLPVTIPRAEADCPVLHATPVAGELRYTERLLIGYRGYDKAGTVPHFAFGHGLGYTTWEYETAVVTAADGDIEIDVTVRNTGARPGREVIQAYLEPPGLTPDRPVRTLRAFTAVTADPGITTIAHLVIPRRSFAVYDGSWVYPEGTFTVRIGRSSRDLRLAVQVAMSSTS
jgi:beta-glucosidase